METTPAVPAPAVAGADADAETIDDSGSGPARRSVRRGRRRLPRAIELALVFFGLPALIAFGVLPLHVVPALWIAAGVCLWVLLRSPGFDPRRLGGEVRPWLGTILTRFLVLAPALALVTALAAPDLLLAMPRHRPWLWASIVLLYPLLSVLPQGVIYRVFFTHRYRRLLPSRRARIVVGAVAFGCTHVVFGNWVAPAITAAGGLLFASTYERSGSALAASLEHALWGCFIFTLGLGRFVFDPGI